MDASKIAAGIFKRAENAYRSFHLKTFSKHDESDNVIRYEGLVYASMKKEVRKVTIRIKLEALISWDCNCPIGKSKCHHMGVVLYHIVSTESCTDEACKWIKKNAVACETQTVNEMIGHPQKLEVSEEEREDIRHYLRNALNEIWIPVPAVWLLKDEADYEDDDDEFGMMDMESIIFSTAFSECAPNDRRRFLEWHCFVNDEEIIEISKKTTGQMKNVLYCILKKYRVTASNFGVVSSAVRRRKFTPSLFRQLLNAYNLNKVKAICWGLDHEETAFQKFKEEYPHLGSFEPIGIFLHKSGIIGASPDGISSSATLEIKCPYKYRCVDDLRTALVPRERYIIYYDQQENKYVVNKKHDYHHQIQAQMYFSKRYHSFLFIWTINCHALVPIDRDPLWESNISSILNFYVDVLMPHVLNNKDLEHNDTDSELSSEDEET